LPGGSGSEPYGIAVTSDGVDWYSESGVRPNTLVRFAPQAQAFSKEAIPSGGGTVRNSVGVVGPLDGTVQPGKRGGLFLPTRAEATGDDLLKDPALAGRHPRN